MNISNRQNRSHIILIGNYVPEKVLVKQNLSYCKEDISSIIAQKAFIDGVSKNNYEISVVSVVSTESNKLIKTVKLYEDNIAYYSIVVKKFFYIDKLFKLFYYTFAIKHYMLNSADANIILFVHGVTSGGCRAAGVLKALFPQISTALYVLDLPEFMNLAGDRGLRRILKKLDIHIIKKYIYNFDKYIVVAKDLISKMSIIPQKSILVEGMYNGEININPNSHGNLLTRTILYAGTLRDEKSIKTIINAFLLANLDNVVFVIYGFATSQFERYLISISHDCPNIKYLGFCPDRQKLLIEEKKADLLLMLRDPSLEYTKYSFPSKLFEFMASGTPILSSRLAGIADEYYDYMFVIEKFSEYEIASCLNNIFKMQNNELRAFGERAQHFIKEHKTANVQVKKILNFIVGENTNA